ncbi:hypothetical protein [Jeotgalibacillus sp. JSM ZJ347]|uniref:hypothetical protein n=1 Tax=Jeotgalibacillus sp. JSM ZJ347 TaxID=3342117 RepID=UPI0035A8BEE1
MTKHKWTEQEIENQLKKMPVVKNRLNPEDIYQHVGLRKRAVKPFPWMPAAAGTAAAALMLILAPGLFDQSTPSDQESSSDMAVPSNESASEESMSDAEMKQDSSEDQHAETNITSEPEDTAEESVQPESDTSDSEGDNQELETVTMNHTSEPALLFEKDLGKNRYFEAGLVTEDAYVIPFTIVVPEGDENESIAALYQQWADKIDESSLGFMDYHPLSDSLNEEGSMLTGLINNLDEKTQGASAAILIDVLRETFGSDYEQFRIINEKNETAEVGEFGRVESYELDNDQKGFYLYEIENGSYYYAKSYENFDSVEDALSAIEEQVPNDRYTSPVPEEIDVNYQASGTTITVSFEGEPNQLPEEERRQLIESILLTAESFALQSVQFEGLEEDFLDGYDFNQPVNVPLGGNIAYLE